MENQALDFWSNIWLFTPENYEFDYVWHPYWSLIVGGSPIRRTQFELSYGFTHGQRIDPITQELRDVTIISNSDYFAYVSQAIIPPGIDCEGLMFPDW